jgi:hypothetical protein
MSTTEALIALVSASTQTHPYELHGFKWCQVSHSARAEALGVSEKTIRRIVGSPPGIAPFVSTCRIIEGRKITLLRVGEPGPQTPEDVARMMVAIWRKWLSKARAKIQNDLEKETKAHAIKTKIGSGSAIDAAGEGGDF